MKKILLGAVLFSILVFLGLKCAPDPHDQEHELHLLDKIREHQTPIHYELSDKDLLDTSKLLIVHAGLPDVDNFFTEMRTSSINSFPCSNCHSKSLPELQANRDTALRKAHWNIHLVHAGANAMNCTTCHGDKDMDQLISLTGEMMSFDESFKLCGQCHSTQFKDWQGGAHGKQLNGWKPPRFAKTCVSCHNPHQPAFSSRFPARLNTKVLGE